MIHVERPPAPEFVKSAAFVKEQERLQHFFLMAPKQQRYDFQFALLKKFKPVLQKAFHNKCAYCESPLDAIGFGDIEQYRPKTGYWWLAYKWENQLISCQVCNQRYKGVFFPVSTAIIQRAKETAVRDWIKLSTLKLNTLEKPFLLNPFDDKPEKHLKYIVQKEASAVSLVPLTTRGKVTIETMGLNRPELKKSRFVIAVRFTMILESVLRLHAQFLELKRISPEADRESSNIVELTIELKKRMLSSSPYAGMTRQLLSDFEKQNGPVLELGKRALTISKKIKPIPVPVSLPSEAATGITINKFIPCEIEISNFKSIGRLHLRFRDLEENKAYAEKKLQPGEDWTTALRESWLLLLGENGVGKSSVLQAIVLALLPEAERNQYIDDPKGLVKKGTQKGFVKIKIGDKEPVEMHFTKGGNITGNIQQYNDFLLAYGATRLLPKGKLEPAPNTSKIKVQNLFDYSVALENALEWLLQRNEDDFDQAALFIKDLLFLKADLLRQDGKIYTQENGQQLELGWLSDGHKTLLALAVDMLKTFATQETDARYRDVQQYASGMVLIDEIGTHLHPRWKMKIVERLRNALPKVFFIVTSHEPLCMRGLRDKEVVVLKRDDTTGEINTLSDLPSPDGMRVDQLLTSKYFGLNSTIDPEVETKFEQYYQLLGKPEIERTAAENTAIAQLQTELKAYNQLGDNLREELFYYVVDELIAKNLRQGGNMKTKEDLKTDVKEKIETLLKEIDINIL
jgi:energy-coupling factor transporter ATP-binding protein EcfA2